MLDFLFYHTPLFYLTQSIWRDEAFSYFLAKPSFIRIIQNTANDFNPPLYYILLHMWILLVGKSDIGLRFLSLVAHAGTTYIAYLFGRNLFSSRVGRYKTASPFGFYLAAFTFFNPMLLQYAFELRMYTFYSLFTLGSMYFFYRKQWKWYTLFTILGLYTHSFFILIPFSFVLYLLVTKHWNKRLLIKTALPSLFFIPWFVVLIDQFRRSAGSWVYPVDFQLIKSSLGNLFTGYDGTPGFLWDETALLSLLILIAFCFLFYRRPKLAAFCTVPIVIPLTMIIWYSLVKQPLYVNRYLIFITVFEIIGIASSIWSIKNTTLRNIALSASLTGIMLINLYLPVYKKKADFKSTFSEINRFAKPGDFAYSATPIGFLESAYYYKYSDRVFIYNPQNREIPNYIGVTVAFPNISRSYFPQATARTFLIADDATYEMIINQ